MKSSDRSVTLTGAPLLSATAPVTSDVLWTPQEGNDVSGRTKQAHAPEHESLFVSHAHGRRVLHWVQRPVHANHHSTSWGVPLEGDAFEAGIAVGQTRENGRNRHRGWHESGVARLAAWHRSQKERRSGKDKEGGRGHRPCEARELWFGCSHVGNAVAEVGRRHLVPNTLGKRALEKGGQGRVNGDLARSERRRVKPSASKSGEGTSAGRAHRTKTGANRPRPTVA
jgi:hypothetical protein